MKSTEIETQIADAQTRRAAIAAQLETANAELKKAQIEYSKSKTPDAAKVTTAQAKAHGISGSLDFLDEELTNLQIEHAQTVADETRAQQLAELDTRAKAAGESWQAYCDAYNAALQAFIDAAKAVRAADEQHTANTNRVINFLAEKQTVVTLSDLQDVPAGATTRIESYGKPPMYVNGLASQFAYVFAAAVQHATPTD